MIIADISIDICNYFGTTYKSKEDVLYKSSVLIIQRKAVDFGVLLENVEINTYDWYQNCWDANPCDGDKTKQPYLAIGCFIKDHLGQNINDIEDSWDKLQRLQFNSELSELRDWIIDTFVPIKYPNFYEIGLKNK